MSTLRGLGRWLLIAFLIVPTLANRATRADDPGAAHRIDGLVTDPKGKPIADAVVVAAVDLGDIGAEPAPDLVRPTQTDPSGHFAIDWPDRAARRGPASLWVAHEGSRLVRIALASHPATRSVPVTLNPLTPAAEATVGVLGPRGEPIAGARVIPTRWVEGGLTTASARNWSIPPAVGDRLAGRTDAEGQVRLDTVAALRLAEIRVSTPQLGDQLAAWDDTLSARHHQVWLRPVGRVVGRVTGADDAAGAGLTVRIETMAGTHRVGSTSTTTDPTGHFEVAHVAAGTVEVQVEPRPGTTALPDQPPKQELAAGGTADVAVRLHPGVRVAGLIRAHGKADPVAGVWVELRGPGRGTWIAETDSAGRFETLVRPGAVTARVVAAPRPYLIPPELAYRDRVKPSVNEAPLAWPPIELERGVMLHGRTRDAAGQPVGSPVEVEARWSWRSGRAHDEVVVATTTEADGRFEVGPVPTGVEISLDVRLSGGRTSEPQRVAGDRIGSVVDLVVPRAGDLLAPVGRVVDLAGHPVAGALVQIRIADRTPMPPVQGPRPGRRIVTPELESIVTDAQGQYHGPAVLEPDRSYLASAESADCEAGHTRAVASGLHGDSQIHFPDLVLDRHQPAAVLVGQVVDRDGKPIAGVKVRDLARHETITDDAGQFRLSKSSAAGPSFLFAHKAGYRFLGRSLATPGSDPNRPLILEMSRAGEPMPAGLAQDALDGAGPQTLVTWMIRSLVVNPLVDQVLTRNDKVTSALILERLARVEPRQVILWLDAGVVRDRRVADGLRRIAARHLAATDFPGAMAAIHPIDEIEVRTLATLDAVVAAGSLSPDQRRATLTQVERDARSIDEPAARVTVLARVASAWIQVGNPDQARLCLADAQRIAGSLPAATTGAQAWSALIDPLAELDPAVALERLSHLVDPVDLDRSRLSIALRAAHRDPRGMVALFRRIKSPTLQVRNIPQLCYRLAPVDLAQARGLADSIAASHPTEAAYALGMMAASLVQTDRPQAIRLIHEAYARLDAAVDAGSVAGIDANQAPAVVAALLLPTVEAVDPAALAECFWKSLALHPSKTAPSPQRTAILAMLLDRYDRATARHLFDAGRLNSLAVAPADLAPLLLAAAQIAPDLACRWVLAPVDPTNPKQPTHLPAGRSHIELVAALTSSDRDRWNQAAHRFLHLWTPDGPTDPVIVR